MLDPILEGALNILNQGNGLSKGRVLGQTLLSAQSGPPIIDPDILASWYNGVEPNQRMQQALIFALDFLAVGLPDNDQVLIAPEIQRIAGKLRERYSRAYKCSAYLSID